MNYKINTRKLRKVIDQFIAEVEQHPINTADKGGHYRGVGATIGKIGDFYISIDVDQYDNDDVAIHTNVFQDKAQ